MEKLLLSIKNESNFYFSFMREDIGKIEFLGGDRTGSKYNSTTNEWMDTYEYCIGEDLEEDIAGFTLHFIYKLEDVKKFICKKYSEKMWFEICEEYEKSLKE